MLTRHRITTAFALAFAAALALALLAPLATRPMRAASAELYVSPSGDDASAGADPAHPLRTIQRALDLAQPGTRITLAPGVYKQDIRSVRDGLPSAPITLAGPADAVIKGAGSAHVVEINHDNITLQGFTIDGLWGDPNQAAGYRDKLLYVLGKQPRDGVSGLRVLGMTFRNAGGECVRLRYFAQRNEIAGSTIATCGVHDFRFGAGGKNGEGIYIGTAPEQRGDGKNPTADPDQSSANWIHNNSFDTQGNECVDIKEAASANLVENNRCTGQRDPESGGMDARGSGNIFRSNEIFGSAGAGVRLGGDTAADGTGNDMYDNRIHDNKSGGIKFQRQPQGRVCGNLMANNAGGDAVGSYASAFHPAAACPAPGAPTPTRTPAPTAAPASPTAAPASPTAAPAPTSAPNTQSAGCTYTVSGASTSLIEAERYATLQGRLTPVADAQASGGAYLAVTGSGPRDPGTYATYRLTVTKGGSFRVWLRGYGADGSSDSFYLRVDGGALVVATLTQGQWGWHRVGTAITLNDGPHTLTLLQRENGARVDKLLLTRDSKLTPSGLGAPALAPACS
jgi:hypothetical protein